MAQTIDDIVVNTTWQSINTLTGIPVGTAMIIHNKTNGEVLLSEGTQPVSGSLRGVPVTSFHEAESVKIIPVGSLEIWGRVEAVTGTARLSVQDNS